MITVLTWTDTSLDVSSDTTTSMTDIPTNDVPTTDYDAATDIKIYIQF